MLVHGLCRKHPDCQQLFFFVIVVASLVINNCNVIGTLPVVSFCMLAKLYLV